LASSHSSSSSLPLMPSRPAGWRMPSPQAASTQVLVQPSSLTVLPSSQVSLLLASTMLLPQVLTLQLASQNTPWGGFTRPRFSPSQVSPGSMMPLPQLGSIHANGLGTMSPSSASFGLPSRSLSSPSMSMNVPVGQPSPLPKLPSSQTSPLSG